MPEVMIQEITWQGLIEVARRRRKRPEKLAEAVLQDYLQQQADEALLERSSQAAQQTVFPINLTEKVIREYRKRKKNP